MNTREKKTRTFEITDRTVSRMARFCCMLLVAVMTLNFVGITEIGASDDITLQLHDVSETVVVGDSESTEFIPVMGIDRSAYEDKRKTSNSLASNTYIVVEQISENGTPIELIDESEFVHDGSKMWVSCSQVNVRENPSADSQMIVMLKYSDKVTRLSYGNYWSKIRMEDGSEGFILSDLLSSDEILAPTATPTPTPTPKPKPKATATPTPTPKPETPTQNEVQATPTQSSQPEVTETEYFVTLYASCAMNLRTGPGTDYSLVRVLNTGDEITVVASTSNGWYKTAKGNYVKASLCTETAPAVVAPNSGTSSGGGSNPLADYCLQYVGCPYVYAGSSPSGFDCSGFVMYVYANYYGVSLPHSADSISKYGTAVSSSEMIPGDVVCNDHNGDGYMDHVSIYIGDGYIVHASTSTTGVIKTSFAEVRDVTTIRRIA